MGLISGIPRYSYITHSSAELAALHAGILGSLGIPRTGTTMLLPSSGTNFQSAGSQGIAQEGGRKFYPSALSHVRRKCMKSPLELLTHEFYRGGND